MPDNIQRMSMQHQTVESIESTDATETVESAGLESLQSQGHDSITEAIDDLDSILDDIEMVLENNAQEYVSNFVQKGGQ